MNNLERSLEDKRRDLSFRLIEVTAKIKALTPEQLDQWMDHNRNRETRTHELRTFEAERDALIEQIRILDEEIRSLQKQAQATKAGPKQPSRKQVVYDRVEVLLGQNSSLTKADAFSQVADELESSDTAVKKAYYDYENDLKEERAQKARRNTDTSVEPPGPADDDTKSPEK